jgi:hypothetical protein
MDKLIASPTTQMAAVLATVGGYLAARFWIEWKHCSREFRGSMTGILRASFETTAHGRDRRRQRNFGLCPALHAVPAQPDASHQPQ